jgi:uncharacterized membrane protein
MPSAAPDPTPLASTCAPLHTAPPRVRSVAPTQPLRWLARGWLDLMRCPVPGLAHGLAAAVFGALIFVLARDRFWLLAGTFSGFLLVAPVVATGLYAVSRALERGQYIGLRGALAAWRVPNHCMVRFGILLALAGTGWVLTSASLITRFAGAPIESPLDFLRVVVLADQSYLFEAWLMLGAVLAAPMFASSVVSLPMLLDRPSNMLMAIVTSVQAVTQNPAAMALWATLILALTALGMATLMLGLVIVVPWLAHATWHAYRDLVELPEHATAPPPTEPH